MSSHQAGRREWLNATLAGLVAAFALLLPGFAKASGSSTDPGVRNGSEVPVVLILLDELPSVNLMTADGLGIDSKRYPRIAQFASGATWYRDNVAGGDFTAWAVPSILTGNLSNEQTLPTVGAQPHNLFTELGPGRRVHSLEGVTEFCPVSICPGGRQGEHPEITMSDLFIKAKYRVFDPAEMTNWISGMPAGKSTLSFVHVNTPHLPLRFLPNGQRYPGGSLLMPNDMKQRTWTAGESAMSFIQQRHLLQTGYADRIVGQILDKVRQNGDFNEAMIVITADHGVSFDQLDMRRDATPTNVGATLNPPLMIKYPGQTRAEVSSASTQSIDIFPTIASRLGAKIPPTAGRPVNEASPDRVMTVSKDSMAQIQVTAQQIRADRSEALATQVRRLGTGGLWRLGPRPDLIGRPPVTVGPKLRSRFRLEAPARIRKADGKGKAVPSLVGGYLKRVGADKVLALSWNGRIVATTRSFTYLNQVRFGAMVPPAVMKRGKSRVALYLVEDAGLRRIPRG